MWGVHASPGWPHSAVCFLCMIKEGGRSRFFCTRQPPAHLSRIIRPPSVLRRAQDPGALSTCGNRVSGSSGKISQAAGPCLMSVAPGVRLNLCLFRQPLWLCHASPAPGQEGQAPEEGCFFILSEWSPGLPWLGSKGFLTKACWDLDSLVS